MLQLGHYIHFLKLCVRIISIIYEIHITIVKVITIYTLCEKGAGSARVCVCVRTCARGLVPRGIPQNHPGGVTDSPQGPPGSYVTVGSQAETYQASQIIK